MEILEKQENNSEKGVIEFRNVSFKYKNPDGEYTDVLKDVSFTANPGKVTAIIGGTGSSKSSLIQLIPRLYDVVGGSVLVGGKDVTDQNMSDEDINDAFYKDLEFGTAGLRGVIGAGTNRMSILLYRCGLSPSDIRGCYP